MGSDSVLDPFKYRFRSSKHVYDDIAVNSDHRLLTVDIHYRKLEQM